MNSQNVGGPSTERRPGAGGSGSRKDNQQALDPITQHAPTSAPSYDVMDGPMQKFMGPAAGEGNSTNGSSPPSPKEGRSGRGTDASQSLPYRDRSQSRNNGGMGAKSSNGSRRICKKCGESLTGQFVRALGGTFHLDCFRCRVGCRTTFAHSILIDARIAGKSSPPSFSR